MVTGKNVAFVKPRHWRYFVVLISANNIQLTTIQVSYNNAFFFRVENVDFYAYKLRFADNIGFLLPIEENGCRISSNACRSLRSACSW